MTNLYNPMSTVNKLAGQLDHPYKGQVVQVDSDPNYVGRIKVNIPELYGDYEEQGENNTSGILPWIYPRYYGKFSGLLELEIPEKGDIVEVIFPYKNIYLGYYTNKPLYDKVWDELSKTEEGKKIVERFKTNYPNVYGHLDRNLTGWYVDKLTNEIFIVQGGQKANVTFAQDGALVVNSPTNLIFNAGQSIILNAMTSIEATSETIAMGSTTYNLQSTDIVTSGTQQHTGTITSDGEITSGSVTLTGHTHKYTKPAHGAGDDSTTKGEG